jgi:hypothetical protein
MVIYDPLMYVLMGTGLIWVVALLWPQIHTNALCICELIHDDIKRGDLNLMQNQPFTYKEYANLIDIMVEWVGVSHQSFELLLYVWQTLAGGVHHYMSHRSRSRTIFKCIMFPNLS